MTDIQETLNDLSAMPLKTILALWLLLKLYPPENKIEDLPLVDLPKWYMDRRNRGMDMFKIIDKRIITLTGRLLIGYLGDYVGKMEANSRKFARRSAVAGAVMFKEE